MKILFLDIDGVLNSTRSAVAMGGYPHPNRNIERFDMVAVELIRRICAQGVKVVLSSTWRKHENWESILDLPIIDKTIELNGIRGKEIDEWLQRNKNVKQYAILDDDSDMLPEHMDFFVKTDHSNGFLWDDYVKLCKILVIPM